MSADVTDVAVHCATPPAPTGLDPTFGGTGRVSTSVGGFGHGEAVVIQPAGGIVTAGWHNTPGGADFALTRHDASGNLDHSFGTAGIASTDFGGDDDEAFDAALTPDGGIVAVGRTDAGGFPKQDFAVARYTPDGKPDLGFDADGMVATDILGGGDQANAVAVQPDGKIVVAGSAVRGGIDSDFALVRYNADGTLDDGFGTHGKVTTDLGTEADTPARSSSSRTAGSSSPAPRARTSAWPATRTTATSTPRSATTARRSRRSRPSTSPTASR